MIKKQYFLLLLFTPLLLFSFSKPGQQPALVSPKFPGGDTAIICFYKSNLSAAIVADTANKGNYFVLFTIDSAGNTTDIKITRAPANTEKAQAEIIRVTKLFPKWEPGYSENDIYTEEESGRKHYCSVKMNYPIRFPQIARTDCPKK